jgi:hypothetical protein
MPYSFVLTCTAPCRAIFLLLVLLLTTVAAQATNPVLRITGLNPSGGDNTAFIDRVEIIRASGGAVVNGAVNQSGFETPALFGGRSVPIHAHGLGLGFH